MDTLSTFVMGEINRRKPLMVFDWNKAALIIKKRQPSRATAGLSGDWEWTGGTIFSDGKPVPIDDTYTYLASTWATPELGIDGDIIECYLMEDQMPKEWGDDPAHVYWPQSARDILEGNHHAQNT